MFPRWCRLWFLALVALISLHSEGFANINQAGALLSPITVAPKSCSGAFRYAARVGNNDIIRSARADLRRGPPAFPHALHLARDAGLGADRSVLMSSNTMC